MHPEVRKFIKEFEEKMRLERRNVKLNENEIRFLNDVFGPEFNYDFRGLTAQMPFIDYKGGNRYLDFHLERGVIRIIFEMDSLKFHMVEITHQKYDDHIERQNDLMLRGDWILLRFTANMIRTNPMLCRRQLVQAVGKCLIQSQQPIILTEENVQRMREQDILRLAAENKILKPVDVAAHFQIHHRTATQWLHRLANTGALMPIKKNKIVTGYILSKTLRTNDAS